MTAGTGLDILSWPPPQPDVFPGICASQWKTAGAAWILQLTVTLGEGKSCVQPPTTRSILRRLTRSPRSPFGPGTPCKSEEEISSYLGCCAELRHENVSFCSGQRHFSLTSVKMGSRKGTGGTGSPTKQNGVFVHIKRLDLSWRDAAVWSQGSGMAQQYCQVTMSSPVIPSHLPTPNTTQCVDLYKVRHDSTSPFWKCPFPGFRKAYL